MRPSLTLNYGYNNPTTVRKPAENITANKETKSILNLINSLEGVKTRIKNLH